MTSMSDLDGKTCRLIGIDDLKVGDLTALGFVTEQPKFSPSRKTVLVTVDCHGSEPFTDRRSARAKIAVWR